MVSFRKLFLVLAVLGVVAGTASAQITSCSVQVVNVPLARFEGLTEPVGDILISCTGTASASQSISFVLRSGTANFTNSLTDTATPPTTTAVIKGTSVNGVLATANELDFNDVPLAGTNPTITITGVRVNANAVGTPNTNIAMTITGTAVTPGQSLAILPPTSLTVASVQSGLNFSVKAKTATLPQCNGAGKGTATVTFAPGYAYAFRAPGTTSSSEPVEPGAAGAEVQLVAIFSNIGANTTITVPNTLVAPSGNASLNAATLVSPAPKSGTTETAIAPSGTTTQTVIWKVTNIDTRSNAMASAPVAGDVSVSHTADSGPIGLGAVAVRGNLGPISAASTALAQSDTKNDLVPRFADLGTAPQTLVTVAPCATTLLFPYVVSQAPWETGIAISNTSKDVSIGTKTFLFGGSSDATGQAGTCTLYYFNGTAGGTNPAAQTTASIAPGNESVFLLGSGSATDTGIGGVPEFAGYVVAQCNFLGAHGFAFGTSGTANLGAFGYNALVLNRNQVEGVSVESLGQ